MSILTVSLSLLIISLIWVLMATHIDVSLFHTKRGRRWIESRIKIRTIGELYDEMLRLNSVEVGLFLTGFFLAVAMRLCGWI